MKIQNYLDKVGIPMFLSLILIVLMSSLIGWSSETVEEENTEMTGELVNIGLSGQIEMCEREPESVLCEDDE